MAYVIFTANGDEIDRRDLTGPITIGRAQDVDVPVRDILLSRKHCKLEPSGEHWIATDLGSKNGTYIGYRQITRQQLKDGDELRIGRTHMTFRAGTFEAAPAGTKRRDIVRPADPTEALAGTVAGFILVEPGEVEREAGAPVPQPRPPEPTSYASEDVYGMLSEIASSSWDSIMAQASRPLVMERPLPRPHAYNNAPRVASRPRVAFCLQAPIAETTAASTTTDASTTPTGAETVEPTSSPRQRWRSPTRWWQISRKARHQIALGVLSAVATAVLVGAWVIAVNQGPPSSLAAPLPKPSTSDLSPEAMDITFPMAQPADRHDFSPSPRELTPSVDAWKTALGIASLHLLPVLPAF